MINNEITVANNLYISEIYFSFEFYLIGVLKTTL